ncbi:MAG TPA: glycosyl hydrolase, partial [bacterium]|nr:glycosyl hydrolase [bacterium]
RTSPGGKPAVYATYNAGKTWKRLDKGFPKKDAYWTVFRQAMTRDHNNKVGLYLGTTSGEVWGSIDEGRSWSCLVRHLPEIFSLEVLTR